MREVAKYGAPLFVLLGLLIFPANVSRYVLPICVEVLALGGLFLACRPLREKENAAFLLLFWFAPLALLWLLSERREGRDISPFSIAIEVGLAGLGASYLIAKKGLAKDDMRLLVAIFLMWAVAFFSGQTGGADKMHPYFRFLGLTSDQIIQLVIWIRKAIHLSFYGSLTWLISTYLWRQQISNRKTLLAFSILFPLSVASCDEFRQSFMPNRQGSVYDVMLDMSAAAVVLIWLFLINKPKPVVT